MCGTSEEQLAIERGWQEKEDWLRQCLDLQLFNRDADQIDVATSAHEAFLDYADMGTIELEIDSYCGLVKEMGTTADGLVKINHPQSKLIKERQHIVNQELKELQKLSGALRTKLMESMYRHEYMREAEQLETWVQEQMITATSQDFGQDYEHLLVLQAKFLDFKHRVEAGYERFNQCEELAKKLVANDSPYTHDIETNQLQLRAAWNALLDAIANRDEKLDAAAEIHRFNRDVADALSRIHEKDKMVSDDLGKDVHSVQALLRKHEGFENDLVALEAQLQVRLVLY
ncbi:hypothetical protein HAZT_HAZT000964 [Hyalella azteca]|uniref:Uncharacterized protein n=1 Tax=Hyalella azteca TaxID=294128 RepID=A0A6A0GY09_HYAAZ|nr:hypothetical protein HAZT_HAZT000964 [Hyalella azteca]